VQARRLLAGAVTDDVPARACDRGSHESPLASSEHIVWRHIPDGTVQSRGVVVIYVGLNQASRIFLWSAACRGRMHSDFSDLCQRSSLPFDCG